MVISKRDIAREMKVSPRAYYMVRNARGLDFELVKEYIVN